MAKTEERLETHSNPGDPETGDPEPETETGQKAVEMKEVWTVGKYPLRIGVAFIHGDGIERLRLNALPPNLSLLVKPRVNGNRTEKS